jgi:hypothetical protein
MYLGGSSRIRLLLTAAVLQSATSFAQLTTDFTLARGRVGPLRDGMTIEQITKLFGPQRVKEVDLHLEGESTPALEIRLDNPMTARASITAEYRPQPDGSLRVWRVNVFDRRFRTADGLGVGSTLGEIRAHHEVQILVGEGIVVAHVDELDMSFNFGLTWYPSTHLPASARVVSVLVL